MSDSADHVAIVEPDERGRFHLRKFFGKVPGARYRVYIDATGDRLTLERAPDRA